MVNKLHEDKYRWLQIVLNVVLVLSVLQAFFGLIGGIERMKSIPSYQDELLWAAYMLMASEIGGGILAFILAALGLAFIDNTYANMEMAEMMRRQMFPKKPEPEKEPEPVSTHSRTDDY